jgi:hypothetical protein
MTAYPTRYVELHRRDGWDAESFHRAKASHDAWRAWANGVLSTWREVPHRAALPRPDYTFGDPYLVEDGQTIRIAIDGDPLTHGAFMIFEDSLPPLLTGFLEENQLADVEVRYINRELEDWKRKNVREAAWSPRRNFIPTWVRFLLVGVLAVIVVYLLR